MVRKLVRRLVVRWAAPHGFCGKCRQPHLPGRMYLVGQVIRCERCAPYDAHMTPPYQLAERLGLFATLQQSFRYWVAEWINS